MGFQSPAPNYCYSTDSTIVNLNPPVCFLIWNTFHEPLRSIEQMARFQQAKSWKIFEITGGHSCFPEMQELDKFRADRQGLTKYVHTQDVRSLFHNETWRQFPSLTEKVIPSILRRRWHMHTRVVKALCSRNSSARNTYCLIQVPEFDLNLCILALIIKYVPIHTPPSADHEFSFLIYEAFWRMNYHYCKACIRIVLLSAASFISKHHTRISVYPRASITQFGHE